MNLFAISPSDSLSFDLDPSAPKTEFLHLTNTSSANIAYKIRTTASKSYLVKPSQGYLKPNEEITISVTLQISEVQSESKHKFLVLATHAVNCEDFSLWSSIPKEKIFDVKLDVEFGTAKAKTPTPEIQKKSSSFTELKGLSTDTQSLEELNITLKKLEIEKNQLEAKINQVNTELRNKEMRPRRGEVVKFKREMLASFAIGGLIFGYMYS